MKLLSYNKCHRNLVIFNTSSFRKSKITEKYFLTLREYFKDVYISLIINCVPSFFPSLYFQWRAMTFTFFAIGYWCQELRNMSPSITFPIYSIVAAYVYGIHIAFFTSTSFCSFSALKVSLWYCSMLGYNYNNITKLM